MQAVDLVPLRPITRDAMIQQLCAVHARAGGPYGVGLGFYVGLRFHIDSRKFRTWGVNDEGTIACARSYEIAHSSDPDALTATPPPAVPQQPPAQVLPRTPERGISQPPRI
jgi:hypothetical protein